MTDPRRKIEEFCARHPNFGIPNLMRYIVIANVVFWILGAINQPLMSYLYFNPALILRGQIWRIISFVFSITGSAPPWKTSGAPGSSPFTSSPA